MSEFKITVSVSVNEEAEGDKDKQTVRIDFEPALPGEKCRDEFYAKLTQEEKGCLDTVSYLADKVITALRELNEPQ